MTKSFFKKPAVLFFLNFIVYGMMFGFMLSFVTINIVKYFTGHFCPCNYEEIIFNCFFSTCAVFITLLLEKILLFFKIFENNRSRFLSIYNNKICYLFLLLALSSFLYIIADYTLYFGTNSIYLSIISASVFIASVVGISVIENGGKFVLFDSFMKREKTLN
jgi:hypothetical protein